MRIFSIDRKGFRNLVAKADIETLLCLQHVLEVCIHGEKFDDQTIYDSHLESLSLVVARVEKIDSGEHKSPSLGSLLHHKNRQSDSDLRPEDDFYSTKYRLIADLESAKGPGSLSEVYDDVSLQGRLQHLGAKVPR